MVLVQTTAKGWKAPMLESTNATIDLLVVIVMDIGVLTVGPKSYFHWIMPTDVERFPGPWNEIATWQHHQLTYWES